MFSELLRDLASHDLIGQMENGELVLGLSGERLVNHYEFFAAFTSSDEYQLYHSGRSIGSLPISFALYEGLRLIFAGRRWTVLQVDEARKRVDLGPALGGRAPLFGGAGAPIHAKVREVMRDTYLDTSVPAFLDPRAKDLLGQARANFRDLGLATSSLVGFNQGTVLLPWCGDVELNTILMMLRSRGYTASMEPPAIVLEDLDPEQIVGLLAKLHTAGPPDPYELAASVENKRSEKHHRFLGESLLGADYALSRLDPDGAHAAIGRLIAQGR